MSAGRNADSLIDDVLKESRLPKAKQAELRRELESHFWEAAEAATPQDSVIEDVTTRFGETKTIAQAFSAVHGHGPSLADLAAILAFAAALPALFLTVFGVAISRGQMAGFLLLMSAPCLLMMVGSSVAKALEKRQVAELMAWTAFLGQTFALSSWILSIRPLASGEALYRWTLGFSSVSKAGFPLTGLELPPPPLGGGIVPAGMWSAAFGNQIVSFIIALLAALCIRKLLKPMNRGISALNFSALAVLAYQSAVFILWFD